WLNGGLGPLLDAADPVADIVALHETDDAGFRPRPVLDRQGLLNELSQARADLVSHSVELAAVRRELVGPRPALRAAQGEGGGRGGGPGRPPRGRRGAGGYFLGGPPPRRGPRVGGPPGPRRKPRPRRRSGGRGGHRPGRAAAGPPGRMTAGEPRRRVVLAPP